MRVFGQSQLTMTVTALAAVRTPEAYEEQGDRTGTRAWAVNDLQLHIRVLGQLQLKIVHLLVKASDKFLLWIALVHDTAVIIPT